MNDVAVLIPAVTGFLGVVVGAVLGPVVNGYFAKRDRTISVRVFDRNPPTIISPHKSIQIMWEGRPIEKMFQIGFELTNSSRTKLRNFSLEIDVDSGDDHGFDIALEDNSRARWSEVECPRVTDDGRAIAAIFRFEFIEAGETVRGTVVTDTPANVRFISTDDVEVKVRYDSRNQSQSIVRTILDGIFGIAFK